MFSDSQHQKVGIACERIVRLRQNFLTGLLKFIYIDTVYEALKNSKTGRAQNQGIFTELPEAPVVDIRYVPAFTDDVESGGVATVDRLQFKFSLLFPKQPAFVSSDPDVNVKKGLGKYVFAKLMKFIATADGDKDSFVVRVLSLSGANMDIFASCAEEKVEARNRMTLTFRSFNLDDTTGEYTKPDPDEPGYQPKPVDNGNAYYTAEGCATDAKKTMIKHAVVCDDAAVERNVCSESEKSRYSCYCDSGYIGSLNAPKGITHINAPYGEMFKNDRFWSGECTAASDFCTPEVSRFGEIQDGVATPSDVDKKGNEV